ncbi:MAG: phosphomethylpyrimidine synthase ThiC [Elusimicrobiota bacterium]
MSYLSNHQLKQISLIEERSVDFILKELKQGRATILKNKNRKIKPVIVGRNFKCKYNLNLGLSPQKSSVKEELKKLDIALRHGADTVMDLSVGKKCDKTRIELLKYSPVPFGTVPIYTMIEHETDIKRLNRNEILESIQKQCEEGVDFMTIHAGLLKKSIPYIKKRLSSVVSRGGSLVLRYISETGRENPFYEYFDDIINILKKYDVVISIGDGLRPGSIYDATDKAQISELKVIGELNRYSRERGVMTMIEGPGHLPINEIKKNVDIAIKYTNDAPLYFLGPLVSDIALGYDHINGAIGGAIAGYLGVSLICAVGPSEHLGLPTMDDIKEECVVFNLVKHAVNLARGFENEFERNKKMSEARAKFDWERQFNLSLFPEYARKKFCQLNKDKGEYCSMCGSSFCAMKNSKKAQEAMK